MRKRYVVHLTGEERERLEDLVRRGRAHARRLLYARILLKADASEAGPAWAHERIADALETSAATVARERRPPSTRRSPPSRLVVWPGGSSSSTRRCTARG